MEDILWQTHTTENKKNRRANFFFTKNIARTNAHHKSIRGWKRRKIN